MLPTDSGFSNFLARQGFGSKTLRAKVQVSILANSSQPATIGLTVHPGPQAVIDAFLDRLRFDPNQITSINVAMPRNGLVATWPAGATKSSIPPGTTWDREQVIFWSEDQPLNEFGYLYVALFIAGNYARYFPDRWIWDVERSTPLALAIEELLRIAEMRMALLALSELTGVYQIPYE